MTWDPNALKIYVDGSCLKNPGGSGGLAGIAEYPDNLEREAEAVFQVGYTATTNNRMELRACIQALEYVIQESSRLRSTRAIIITDSLYVYDGQNSIPYWRRDNWRTKSGTPVDNADLWKIFISLRSKIRASLQVQWEEGKTRQVLKNVDSLAKEAARRPTETDFGFSGGKVYRSKTTVRSASTPFPASGSVEEIHIYKKEIIGKEYKVNFDLIVNHEYVGKYHAYTTEAHELHRAHCYKVKFNTNPKYPQILSVEMERICPVIQGAPE